MTEFQKQSREEYTKLVAALDKRDWNKNWPSADKEAPKVCTGCRRKLPKLQYMQELLMKPSRLFPNGLRGSSMGGKWRIDCKCGVTYIWSFPNVWIRTHRIIELMMFINDDGSLLQPFPV